MMKLKEEIFRKLRSSTALFIMDARDKNEMVKILKEKLTWWEAQ